jgi:c-di-GMP-binding flagellar brake protein YcgR
MLRKIFNRRKHPRFFADQKTYLVVQPSTRSEKKLQILDISEGGCGFVYYGNEEDLESSSIIALMCNKDTYFEQIKISTVSDQPASGPFRRRGVEFKWLGSLDKKKMNSFIKRISICKCQ